MINVGDLLAILRLQDELSPALDVALVNLQKLEKGVYSSNYQLTLLGRGARELGTLFTGAFTVPFTAAIHAVSEFGGGFESEMTKVMTLAGASRQEIDSLRQSVLNLGDKTAVAPEELAQGLFSVESFGLKGAKAMETLGVAAKMSALGMGTAQDDARALTGALFAYREQNLSAAEAGDILAKTVQLGNMRIDELVPALARVNPVASAMGVSFQDVAAAIATFTHAGVDSSTAATGIRAILSNILQDSVKTEKGFRALAEATGDNTISMANFRKEMSEKGLTQAMVDLANNVRKAGDAGISAFAQIIPNIRGLTEAFGVYLDNGGMVLDLHEKLVNSAGTIDKATEELEKTWDQQWKHMQVAVKELWIQLGDAGLLKALKDVNSFFRSDLVPVLGEVIHLFSELPTPIKDTILVIGGLLALIGPFLIIAGQLVMAIGNLARGWGALKLAVLGAEGVAAGGGIGAIFTAVGLAALTATPYIIGIGAALTVAYQAWMLYREHAARGAAADKQASIDAQNLGLIEGVAGQKFKDLGDAMEWARHHAIEAQREFTSMRAGLATLGTQADNTKVNVKSLLDRVAELTEEQKKAIVTYHEAGLSTSQIAKEMGHYAENIHVTSDVIGIYLRQQESAMVADAKQKAALIELSSAGKDWAETIQKMNPALVSHIETALKAGASQSVVQAAYRATATEVRAVTALIRTENEEFKKEEAQLNSITKTWEQYQAAVNAGTSDTIQKKLETIDILAAREIEALSKTTAYNAASVAIIKNTADQLKANIVKSTLEASDQSKAHFEKIAADAQSAFEFAAAHADQFSTEWIQHLRDVADQARITAATFSGIMISAIDVTTQKFASVTPQWKAMLEEAARPGSLLRLDAQSEIFYNTPPNTAPHPGLATGGPVSAGQTYMVGEKGAELFTPSSSGSITANSQLGTTIVNVNMSGLLLANSQSAREDLRRYLIDAISEGTKRNRKFSVA